MNNLFSGKDFSVSRETGSETGTTREKGQTTIGGAAETLTRASCLWLRKVL